MMPVMDGFKLLAAIRADPALAEVPVVMLSARAGEEAEIDGLDAGADDYLSKPFSARELLARVSANLNMARTRRRAADEVRASRAQLQVEREFLALVLAKAPIGISIAEPGGRVAMLNERAVELLGHRHEAADAEGFSAYGGVHADGRHYSLDDYPTLRAVRGERIEGERMIYLRGGCRGEERIVLEVDAVPIRDADGKVAGAVTVFDDAGAREQAEEALRARVDRAVAEREAAREELHQLQKLETIGQLTGGVAHDFNNLLTPIVGALDLMARRLPDDTRMQRIISGAQQSAERARALVSRLLTFGRRQHLAPQPLNIGALVAGMADLIRHSLNRQIDISYSIEDGLPAVMADPGQLELAILNLCVNSRDAMPTGGKLVIGVKAVSGPASSGLQPEHLLCISVTDTGLGMDRDTLERAIEPFYTTKDVGRGTGLGLSMVHGLAAQSGGRFEIESEVGRGTVAKIYLPAIDLSVEPIRSVRREVAVPRPRLRILLVDDEELVRVSTAEMLESLGHEVLQAASGATALHILRTDEELDVLIADYMMPGMTGVTLVENGRRARPNLPALLITGYAAPGVAPNDGIVRLGKPFGQNEIAAAIADLLA
jgi:PAS domain S-box-containing protein